MFTGPKARKLFPDLRTWAWLTLGLILLLSGQPAAAQQDPLPSYKVSRTNQLSTDWLVYQRRANQFSLYIPDYHGPVGALYQWVEVKRGQPFVIGFTAKKDLCLFINNQLVFTADSVASYALDLTRLYRFPQPEGRYLLCIWHPTGQPDFDTFKNLRGQPRTDSQTPVVKSPAAPWSKSRVSHNYNAFIIFLLLIGLIYGSLRTNYASDFQSLFRVSNFMRYSALEEGFLAKPISSWSSILFVVAFSLSFALLIVAIHTNIQNIVIFNRLFSVSETDITSRILFYTLLTFSFVLVKLLFLTLMGYIFDLTPLVSLQYREFVRTLLFMGIFFPLIMVVYLAFNTVVPQVVLWLSNIAVSTILIVTVLRIFYTLNKKFPLRNLHLFSYICATEIIPLIILLKLIVFNY
ncbi:MAG: DUF4271 domain-containing protein [Adhaeribacter sp.]